MVQNRSSQLLPFRIRLNEPTAAARPTAELEAGLKSLIETVAADPDRVDLTKVLPLSQLHSLHLNVQNCTCQDGQSVCACNEGRRRALVHKYLGMGWNFYDWEDTLAKVAAFNNRSETWSCSVLHCSG